MKNTEIAKNQHYVPQFILKNFTVGKKPQIWVFDKKTGKKFKTNIKNVASETKFYDFSLKDLDLTIEPALADVEEEASKLINRIVKEEEISHLNDNDKIFISHFLALQFTRTKQHRLRFQDLIEKMSEEICKRGWTPENIQGYKELTENDLKIHGIKSIFDSHELAPHFFAKSWLLFQTTKKHPLYISDNPITLQNMNDYGFYGNIGLAVKGIEIYFPISKTLTLALFCPSIEESLRETYKKFQFLSKVNPLLISQNLKEPHYLEETMAGFLHNKTVHFDPDNVINHNSLQVKYASRFVFSSTDDFSLVEEMISKHPSLKEGPKVKIG